MQIEYVLFGGIAALAGFIINLAFTLRNVYSTTKRLSEGLQIVEENLNKKISETSFDELKRTYPGRELLQLIGTAEALAKLHEPYRFEIEGVGFIFEGDIFEIHPANLGELRDRLKSRKDVSQTNEDVDKTAKSVIGGLAKEASSEIVQQELEAMRKAIDEPKENVTDRASSFAAAKARLQEALVKDRQDLTAEELELLAQDLVEMVENLNKQRDRKMRRLGNG